MKKILLYLVAIFSISILQVSCTNLSFQKEAFPVATENSNNINPKQNVSEIDIKPITKKQDSFKEYELESLIINELNSLDRYDVNWTLAITDLDGELITSVGDVDGGYRPETIFRSIVVGILVDKYGLNLDATVDNSNYVYNDGSIIASVGTRGINRKEYEEATSFRKNFINLNFAPLIREYDKIDDNKVLLSYIQKLGFAIDSDSRTDEHFSLFTIGKDVKISFLDMAKAFVIFAGDGKTVNDEVLITQETSVAMKELLRECASSMVDWNEFGTNNNIVGLFDTSVFRDSNTMDTINTSFVGFSSYDNPEYILVANAEVSLENGEDRIAIQQLAKVVYNIFDFINGKKIDD